MVARFATQHLPRWCFSAACWNAYSDLHAPALVKAVAFQSKDFQEHLDLEDRDALQALYGLDPPTTVVPGNVARKTQGVELDAWKLAAMA